MKPLEKAKKSEFAYSHQAIALLEQIKEGFDIEEFERWVKDNKFIIGSMYIVEYISYRATQKEKANKKHL